jgi:hypothetical protein
MSQQATASGQEPEEDVLTTYIRVIAQDVLRTLARQLLVAITIVFAGIIVIGALQFFASEDYVTLTQGLLNSPVFLLLMLVVTLTTILISVLSWIAET